MVVPFLPATNVLFRVGFVVAERILMLPAAGCCLLVVYGLQRLHERRPSAGPWLRAGLAALLLVYAAKAHRRSLEWTTESRLFRSALRVCPLNAKGGHRPPLDPFLIRTHRVDCLSSVS